MSVSFNVNIFQSIHQWMMRNCMKSLLKIKQLGVNLSFVLKMLMNGQ